MDEITLVTAIAPPAPGLPPRCVTPLAPPCSPRSPPSGNPEPSRAGQPCPGPGAGQPCPGPGALCGGGSPGPRCWQWPPVRRSCCPACWRAHRPHLPRRPRLPCRPHLPRCPHLPRACTRRLLPRRSCSAPRGPRRRPGPPSPTGPVCLHRVGLPVRDTTKQTDRDPCVAVR
jgi:hypothetical protein